MRYISGMAFSFFNGQEVSKGWLIIAAIWFCGCATMPKYFADQNETAPDYRDLRMWAAHPEKLDPADSIIAGRPPLIPAGPVDIFFLHPTTYTGHRGEDRWNAPIDDTDLNKRTDQSTILFQASIFNSVGRLFAPRYRQAHLQAYFTRDKVHAQEAFTFAYADVRRAFQHYLDHYNQGRPIIIASHSQGTTHAKLLLKEFFDTGPLRDKLVAAYLVGMPVEKNFFKTIKPCTMTDEAGCFCSWRTFKQGYQPRDIALGDSIAVINPLSWTVSPDKINKMANQGAVLYKFDKLWPHLVGAQIHHGILWTDKPKFPGSFLLWRRNYHVADFNFFYVNTLDNAIHRLRQYYASNSMSSEQK